jgi:hypothetical protein
MMLGMIFAIVFWPFAAEFVKKDLTAETVLIEENSLAAVSTNCCGCHFFSFISQP